MADFAKYVLNKIIKYEVNSERFQIIKEKYLLDLKNFDLEQPYQHAIYHSDLCLRKPRYYIKEKLRALKSSTPQTLKLFVPRMLAKIFSEALIHGNCTEKEALEFMEMMNGVSLFHFFFCSCSLTHSLAHSHTHTHRYSKLRYRTHLTILIQEL